MSTNRTALFNKLFKVLKKYYEPTVSVDRSVLENLLYACCLENSMPEAADEAFALLQQYADWNEVRVTTVSELAEVMSRLTDPVEAGRRLKRCLQSIFESRYSFDLEYLKKMPLGKAQAELRQFQGVTPFAVQFVSQRALGGHCIPANAGLFAALRALRLISAKDVENQRIPGLERAIPKTKGIEIGSLLHQLGVEYASGPSSRLKTMLRGVVPDFEFPPVEAAAAAAQPAGDGAQPAGKTATRTVKSAAGARQQKVAADPVTTGQEQAGPASVPESAQATAAAGVESPETAPAVSTPSTASGTEAKAPPKKEATPAKATRETPPPEVTPSKARTKKTASPVAPQRRGVSAGKAKTAPPDKEKGVESRKPEATGKRPAAAEKHSVKSITRRKPK